MKSTMQRLIDLENKSHEILKVKVSYADGTTVIKWWVEIFLECIRQKEIGDTTNQIVQIKWLSDPNRYDNGIAGRYLVELAREINEGSAKNEKRVVTSKKTGTCEQR